MQNALDQAAADLESAEVQLSTAGANRGRMEELRQSNAVTQQEYESAVQQAASARAAVVRAQTNLQLARERRSDVTIRAPIRGTIITDNVEPGQIIASATGNVSGGSVLFTMADLSEMQVRTLVDETDIGQIHPGQDARVTVEAYSGRTFRGQVYKIEPQAVVEQNVTTFPVLVRLSNPEDLLKPGMNAEVAVQIASRAGALVVPNGAVVGLRDAAAAATALGLDPAALEGALRPRRGPCGSGGIHGSRRFRDGGRSLGGVPRRLRAHPRGRWTGGDERGRPRADAGVPKPVRRRGRPACARHRRRGRNASRRGLRAGRAGPRAAPGDARRERLGEHRGGRGAAGGRDRPSTSPAAQMQQKQEQEMDRFRQRAPGVLGAPSGGGRRGG